MESNPYNTPSANLFGSTQGTAPEGVPAEAIVQLQRTKPWLRFIGVIMWLMVGMMLLGTLGLGIAAAVGAGEMMKQSGPFAGVGMIGIAIMYGIIAIIYIYPTVKIWKYGTYIARLAASRSPQDLVAALDQQRSIWKFAGILFILMIVFYIVLIVGVAISAGAAAANGLTVPVDGAANP